MPVLLEGKLHFSLLVSVEFPTDTQIFTTAVNLTLTLAISLNVKCTSKPVSLMLVNFLFFQVYAVVDEMFLAGEVRETSQSKVLKQLQMLQQLE